MQKPLSLLSLVLITLGVRPLFANQQFDLRSAYSYAFGNAPAFKVPRHTTAIANLQLMSARAGFLPKLSLDSEHGILDSEPSINADPWVSNLSLQLTESIYDNGETITKHKIAKVGLQAAKLDEIVKLNTAAKRFTEAYLAHSLDIQLLEAQKRQLNLVKKEYTSIERLFRQGMKTRFDFLRFKAQRMRADLSLINAEADAKLSKEKLIALMGIKVADDKYRTLAFTPVGESETKNLTTTAVSINELPAFRRNQLLSRSAELNIDLASRRYGPEFYLSTGIGYFNNEYVNSGQSFSATERIQWNATLNVKWEVWDWGQRRNAVAIERLTSAIRSHELESDDQELRADFHSTVVRYSKARDSLLTTEELMNLETSNYNLIQSQYRSGQVNYLNLVDGLESLINAQTSYYSSYHNLLQEYSALLSLEGRLHEFLKR